MGTTGFQPGSVMCVLELQGSGFGKPQDQRWRLRFLKGRVLPFPPGADEDSAERPGSPVTWEVSRNARGVRHLEWEGADKACGIAREEREAVWEASLPPRGQGNCGGLQFSAWRWNQEPQSFLPSSGQKKNSFQFFFFFAEIHILV